MCEQLPDAARLQVLGTNRGRNRGDYPVRSRQNGMEHGGDKDGVQAYERRPLGREPNPNPAPIECDGFEVAPLPVVDAALRWDADTRHEASSLFRSKLEFKVQSADLERQMAVLCQRCSRYSGYVLSCMLKVDDSLGGCKAC